MTVVHEVHCPQVGEFVYGRMRNPRVVAWYETLSAPVPDRQDVVEVARWDDGHTAGVLLVDAGGEFWREVRDVAGRPVDEGGFAAWATVARKAPGIPSRIQKQVSEVHVRLAPGEPPESLGRIHGWNRRFERENAEAVEDGERLLGSLAFAGGRLAERCPEPVLVYASGHPDAGRVGHVVFMPPEHRVRERHCWRLDDLDRLRAEAVGLPGVGEGGFMPNVTVAVARPDLLDFDPDAAEATRAATKAVNLVLENTKQALRERSAAFLSAFVVLRDALRDGVVDPTACREALDAMRWEDGSRQALPAHFGTFLAGRAVEPVPEAVDDADAIAFAAFR